MAEVVGLLASVEALADAGFKLVSLISTIRQGGKHRLRLFTELNSLCMILKRLECHFDSSEEEISEQLLDTINVFNHDGGVFNQISETFEDLTDRVQPQKGHRKLIQTLRWPFDKSEVEQLILQLECLKNTVNLAYGSANAAVVREIQNDTKSLRLNAANGHVKAIIDWISDLNFLKQHADFISQAREGTGQWFLQRPEFVRWMSGSAAMLWCPGIMGAGKTYLASIAVEHLKTTRKDQNTAVMILYCGYNQARSQSVDSLIAALIKQVLQIRPAISKYMKELYNVHARTDIFPSLTELTKLLRAELEQFDNCFIIIDGLDEILDEAKRQELLDTLTHGKVNVLVTSRPLDTVKDLFWSLNGNGIICDGCDTETLRYAHHCKQCLGEGFDVCEDCNRKSIVCGKDGHCLIKRYGVTAIEVKATPSDICNYIEWRIDHEPRLFDSVQRKRNLRVEISSTIVQQANGMFLLAKLHMDSWATTRTPRAVQMALQNLPTEIGDTYDRVMERIKATNDQDRAIVMNLLRWVVFATRPLIVAEVEHASSIAIGTSHVDQDNILRARDLTSMCAGLVIVDASDIVRLCHSSAQAYFREHRERWFSNGHTILAQSCLTYLSYTTFETGAFTGPSERTDFKRRMDHYPMIEYSASYWGFHAAHAGPLPEVTDQIFKFLRSKPSRESAVQAMWYSDALDLATFFGLNKVVTKLLGAQEDPVDCRDSLGTTPLMYAAARGHTQVVQTLLRHNPDPNLRCDRGRSALHRAIVSNHNHVEVVGQLLNVSKIDINTADSSRSDFTPLMLAASHKREEIVMMLLRIPSLDVNMQTTDDTGGTTALNVAAGLSNVEIVRQILAHPECDVNKPDRWTTPVWKAAANGLVSVVEVLLDHGADPEIRGASDFASETPLHHAVGYGHVGVVKLLLQRGANAQVVDMYDRTIIHKAAGHSRNEVLRILFEMPTGVDVNQQSRDGRSALHEAAYFDYCETIEFLFENGASTYLRDGVDHSPLCVAVHRNKIDAIELLHKLRKQEGTRDYDKNRLLRPTQSTLDSIKGDFLTLARFNKRDAVQAYIQDSKNDPNVVDLDERSALHIAILHNHIQILKLLLATPNIKINTLDRVGRSPLYWTAWYNNSPAAKLLVGTGAELELKDHFSATALGIAINGRHSDTTMVLLEAGAVPQETDVQAVLQLAAQLGSEGLVEILVSLGGNPERKDEDGKTLVKRAEAWENWRVVGTILRLCEEKEKNRGREKGERELVVR
ncbi:MAG: hypothetical protein Q9212_001706 [Teloschistes hypoglaucus]